MDAFYCTMKSWFSPRWRSERVMQLVEHQPSPLRPRSFDDQYVRVYRLFLVLYLAAGADKDQRDAAIGEYPHVYQAHRLYWHPDTERRFILEACLLTSESFAQIAERFGVEPAAIEYFEKLFFNVRDRLQCRDWIAKVIRGQPADRGKNPQGVMTAAQRGYVYRLFGYHGGPLVLDATIAGLAPEKISLCGQDIAGWFDAAMALRVKSCATAAATIFEVDQKSVLRLLKLALRQQRTAASAKTSRAAQSNVGNCPIEKHIAAFLDGVKDWEFLKGSETPSGCGGGPAGRKAAK